MPTDSGNHITHCASLGPLSLLLSDTATCHLTPSQLLKAKLEDIIFKDPHPRPPLSIEVLSAAPRSDLRHLHLSLSHTHTHTSLHSSHEVAATLIVCASLDSFFLLFTIVSSNMSLAVAVCVVSA